MPFPRISRIVLLFGMFSVSALLIGFQAGAADGQESPPGKAARPTSGGDSIFHETMADMTWQQVETAAREGAVALMTTAVIEEHGPHMGCGIDAYLGYLMCKLTRRELESRGVRTVIVPPLYWGVNSVSGVFPGTFGLRKETMKALVHDILASLGSWGFSRIYNINAHGDGNHIRTGLESFKEAGESLKVQARYLLSQEEAGRFGLSGEEPFICLYQTEPLDLERMEFLDFHAGAFETALVAAFFPLQVNTELARSLAPTRVTPRNIADWARDPRKVTPLGYVGDPASFNAGAAKNEMYGLCRAMAEGIIGTLGQDR